ncbi:MAG TPA: S-methyl-5-thioribose-1-phosphate isomerase [Polyangiaceae bacterium]|nr:S-methyl-5-thioribose-1-phosphate isomerase [Polyangiaceae bacterium]
MSEAPYSPVELLPGDDAVVLLDQRELPAQEIYLRLTTVEEVARAIAEMAVRGAPAIGIAAAYGLVLAARKGADLVAAERLLAGTRPTAVNLFWALARMRRAAERAPRSALADVLAAEARAIHGEDRDACRRMGAVGAALVPDGSAVLTHCNAGALATGGYGTALGVLRAAHEAGKRIRVLANETRPYLQGARLTAWELSRLGMDVTVVTEGMDGHLFSRGEIDLVVVGADRVAANGDVANKIGTYGVACLARLHDRPFLVAAPWSTVDLACPDGGAIRIEERPATEVTEFRGVRLAPSGVPARHPAFDVTPARLVSAIVTERGLVRPVSAGELARVGGAADPG